MSPRMSDEEEFLFIRFQKMLESAGHYGTVLSAVKRLFQKVPHLVSDMLEVMQEEGFNRVKDPQCQCRDHKRRLIELTVEKVKEVISDLDVSQSLGLSSQINSYVAFLDLVIVK